MNGERHQPTPERPSVFVLLAEDQLQSSLRGAVKFVIKVKRIFYFYKIKNLTLCSNQFFIGKYPHHLATLKPHSAELQLLLELAIQWSYLHRWNGTFTERFFSLQRYSACSQRGVSTLGRKEIILSLAAVSLVPFLLAKLDRHLEVARDRQLTNERFGQTLYELTKSEKLLLQHYSTAKQFYQLLKVLLWISYSVGGGRSHMSPSVPFYLLSCLCSGLQLGQSKEEMLKLERSSVASILSQKMTTFFDVALKSGAFLVQFLEYWYSQADVRQMLTTVSEPLIPSPPSKPKVTHKMRAFLNSF